MNLGVRKGPAVPPRKASPGLAAGARSAPQQAQARERSMGQEPAPGGWRRGHVRTGLVSSGRQATPWGTCLSVSVHQEPPRCQNLRPISSLRALRTQRPAGPVGHDKHMARWVGHQSGSQRTRAARSRRRDGLGEGRRQSTLHPNQGSRGMAGMVAVQFPERPVGRSLKAIAHVCPGLHVTVENDQGSPTI